MVLSNRPSSAMRQKPSVRNSTAAFGVQQTVSNTPRRISGEADYTLRNLNNPVDLDALRKSLTHIRKSVPSASKQASSLQKTTEDPQSSGSNGSIPSNERVSIEPLRLGSKMQLDFSKGSLSGTSKNSLVANSHTVREISETWTTITFKMLWSLTGIVLNTMLISAVQLVNQNIIVHLDQQFIENYGGVMVEVILLLSNTITVLGLEEAASCIFGYLLSSEKGFSIAVCGFLQTPPLGKLAFAQSLALTSSSRKLLSQISLIWVVVELLKILTPFSAIAIYSKAYSTYSDTIDCVYFVQDNTVGPFDRMWPNLNAEVGVAENSFGSSFGYLRSEVPGLNITTAFYPPQLISTVNDGDTVKGPGYKVDISTKCTCAVNTSPESLVKSGVDTLQVNQIVEKYLDLGGQMGLTFGISLKNGTIVISNVFSGYDLCGGYGIDLDMPLVCTTTMSNHTLEVLEVQFMTDGISGSVAPREASSVSYTSDADLETWLLFAMNSILEGPISSYFTFPTMPGSLNPLLLWTSSNLQTMDRAYVEAGMETFYAILFKAGIQRTYTGTATSCPLMNLLQATKSTLGINDFGYRITMFFVTVQLFISILSTLAFGVWFSSKFPIGPGVRATQENTYLLALLTGSPKIGIGLFNLCNAETYAIWQTLDMTYRIGESITTINDEEVGKIILDKPGIVRPQFMDDKKEKDHNHFPDNDSDEADEDIAPNVLKIRNSLFEGSILNKRRVSISAETPPPIKEVKELSGLQIAHQNMGQSRKSVMSTASTATANSTIREITETWTLIALKMKWSLFALCLNGLLIFFISLLKNGRVFDVQESVIANYGGVVLELILLICNIISIWSLEEAASCIFGYLLCQKKGFSLAVCGYLQTPSFAKLSFSQTLSLTSPSRKVLTRISFIWIIAESLKLLTPFSAIALQSAQWGVYNDVSDCAYFIQDENVGPVDRRWPNLDTEAGVGEYVFGSSLGIMRSEVAGVNLTTAQYPPTLISGLNNGDTIQGLGFTADILTTCKCATGVNPRSFIAAGVHPSQVNATISNYNAMNQKAGLTFGVITFNNSIRISNVVSGGLICGGSGANTVLPLVCSTLINNHQSAWLQIQFMTDGTSASIAPKQVNLVELIEPADIETWLSFGMNVILNGPTSYYLTPPTVPGSLNPLLWWTSPNLIAIDRALVEAGIETLYAILFKGAIQRTYSPTATQCLRKNTLISNQSYISMSVQGFYITLVMLSIQVAISICSIFAFTLWFLTPNPIGPAVRATQESVYLITLLTSSPHLGIGLNELCNAETYTIWHKLDVVCRIGESLDTLEEEIGKIIVDKPSLVRPLENGKKYF